MANKVIGFVKKGRADAWHAFKQSIKPVGYSYYEIPTNLKYRYPAPGSCPLDEVDHPNLYDNDWKLPFRNSVHNIRPVELAYEDEDPRMNVNYISGKPTWDASHPVQGPYDQLVLDQHTVDDTQHHLNSPELDLTGEEAREQLHSLFEGAHAERLRKIHDECPGIGDYDDDYNQVNVTWRNRGWSGFESSPRMREMFIESEYMAEELVGKHQIQEGKIHPYKGTTKKWQVLDDDCFDRAQIEAMQAAVDAPAPEQLEGWQEKHQIPLSAPFNNANVAKWRDDARAIDSADFDPVLLGGQRESKRRLFLERYERAAELGE